MRTLVRWSPFLELDPLERRMRRMFDFGIGPIAVPAADVYETEGEFVFELEVPGFAEKELTVEVTDRTLTVKGERIEEKEVEPDKTYQLHERLAEAFERRFELPLETDPTKIEAEFKQGVLFVHAPKTKPALPQKIPIALER